MLIWHHRACKAGLALEEWVGTSETEGRQATNIIYIILDACLLPIQIIWGIRRRLRLAHRACIPPRCKKTPNLGTHAWDTVASINSCPKAQTPHRNDEFLG